MRICRSDSAHSTARKSVVMARSRPSFKAAWFKPGQLTGLSAAISAAEGRIHFAGEHASSLPGWMQGALESGVRAAREVNDP